MKVKLIKNEADYAVALDRIEALFAALPGTPESDELELLVHLVETYEARTWPIAPPDPVSAIRFRMEQAGLRQTDLVPYIGSKSKVSEVLNGKRPLSLSMIRNLSKGLGIPASVLLQETRTAPADVKRKPAKSLRYPVPRRHTMAVAEKDQASKRHAKETP